MSALIAAGPGYLPDHFHWDCKSKSVFIIYSYDITRTCIKRLVFLKQGFLLLEPYNWGSNQVIWLFFQWKIFKTVYFVSSFCFRHFYFSDTRCNSPSSCYLSDISANLTVSLSSMRSYFRWVFIVKICFVLSLIAVNPPYWLLVLLLVMLFVPSINIRLRFEPLY